MRRIVTGHDENGKSIITLDGPPARSIGEEVGGLFELWNTDGESITSTDEGVPKEVMDQIAHDNFSQVGAAHTRVDTERHPAMHKTETIDYIILLKGNVTLLVDNDEVDLEPNDVVIQRGTNHAWVNKGSEPALLIAVLIDSKID